MSESLKIVIPMAGLGTRLRPHTWSKPKPLIRIAGKPVLSYILDLFQTLPDPDNVELIFIIGHLGDQVRGFMKEVYPNIKTHYVIQEEMRGQSDAIYLAKDLLKGPMIIAYADTILETSFAFLAQEKCDAVAWVKPVPDPRRFGVVELNDAGLVTGLVEKPEEPKTNLAVVGFYYFCDAEQVISAIEEQMRLGITLKGEYFLTDAINILLKRGISMRTESVEVWLDAGTPEALLDTNRYLLEHGRATDPSEFSAEGVAVIPPVYIDFGVDVHASVIGPYVSLGADCHIQDSIIRNSIIGEDVHLTDTLLEGSILGSHVVVNGQPTSLNLGDSSWAMMK
ncbi:MAG TPA: sugar phosphate nucleotidyltransferase [Anaerolineaceae bacterium]|nr:sugar phosphate nucleotidyltransferase [Anaerolineaceae bacterium]